MLWVGWTIATIAATALQIVVPQHHPAATVISYGAWILGCLALVGGIVVHRPPRTLPWLLLFGSLLSDLIGNTILLIHIKTLGTVPFPSQSDVFWLLKYPLLAAGLMLLINGLSWRRDRAGILDTLIVSVGLGLGVWLLFLRGLIAYGDMSPLTKAVSVAYPLADLLLLAAVIRFFTSPAKRSGTFWHLISALVVLSVSHGTFIWQTSHGIFNNLTAPAFTLCGLLLGGAALHPSMAAFGGVTDHVAFGRVTKRRVMLIGSACLFSPMLLLVDGLVTDGRVDWLAASICCMVVFVLVAGRMVGLVRTVQDQAEQLAAMAYHDALTGIPNRRSWEAELERRLAVARRQDTAVTVGLIDLDLFKRYNDEHGHPAGDALLREAATAWCGQLRAEDLIARYGGEEFGVILQCGLRDAEIIMERVRSVTPYRQTFSAAIARWNGNESAEQLLARIDAALYIAKRDGRDQIMVSGNPITSAPR